MKPEEYRVLKFKYMDNGLSSMEAHLQVGVFIKTLKELKAKMKAKHKSELEIENKLQERFQKEFAKLS